MKYVVPSELLPSIHDECQSVTFYPAGQLWLLSVLCSIFLWHLQIREGDKSIFQVLDWYNDINNFFIDYISQSIHDSENSEVYRFIIGFKNLLRYRHFAEIEEIGKGVPS